MSLMQNDFNDMQLILHETHVPQSWFWTVKNASKNWKVLHDGQCQQWTDLDFSHKIDATCVWNTPNVHLCVVLQTSQD